MIRAFVAFFLIFSFSTLCTQAQSELIDSARISVEANREVLKDSLLMAGKVKDSLNQQILLKDLTWDTVSLNPYSIETVNFDELISLTLYEKTEDTDFWAFPVLDSTIKINSRFGMREHKYHFGTDIDLKIGDTVVSVFPGIVRLKKYDAEGYGNYIIVRHYNGLETLYAHLEKPLVGPEDSVKAGDPIGLGGSTGRSTGPHLHFETLYKGYRINPERFFSFRHQKLRRRTVRIAPRKFGLAVSTPDMTNKSVDKE